MANSYAATQHVVDAQERMLRLAERDYGLSIRDLMAETGIPEATLRSYKKGAVMPITAFAKLCLVIPDDLTSLMLPPGKHVGPDEPADPVVRNSKRRGGLRHREPFAVLLGGTVSMNAVHPAHRADTVRRPGFSLTGGHSHPV